MIKCMASCVRCGMREAPFWVQERQSAQDIIKFVEGVRIRAERVHLDRSPTCRHDRLDIMIPINAEKGIGY